MCDVPIKSVFLVGFILLVAKIILLLKRRIASLCR